MHLRIALEITTIQTLMSYARKTYGLLGLKEDKSLITWFYKRACSGVSFRNNCLAILETGFSRSPKDNLARNWSMLLTLRSMADTFRICRRNDSDLTNWYHPYEWFYTRGNRNQHRGSFNTRLTWNNQHKLVAVFLPAPRHVFLSCHHISLRNYSGWSLRSTWTCKVARKGRCTCCKSIWHIRGRAYSQPAFLKFLRGFFF